MPHDEDLARMKAEMLMQNQPSYDDGVSLLESNPSMVQVGLFGKGPKPVKPMSPPIDVQRRSILGLKPQAEYPVPAIRATDIPVPTSNFPASATQQPPQQAPTPAQPVSPLQSLANKAMNAPISRREVLKKVGQTAVGQILPTPSVTDVVPEIMSPLAAAAQNTPHNTFVPNPGVDKYVQDYVSNMFSDMEASEPFAATTSTYTFVRDYLDGRVPQKELNKFDKLKNRVDKYYDNDDEYSDEATTAQESLANFIQEKLKLLKPHELYDVHENLIQDMPSPEEFYNSILESRGGQGLESLGAEGFAKYLEASEKSPKLVVPEAPTPAQPVSPLNDLANKALQFPVSRREVLKTVGQAALNQALPVSKMADVVPDIMSPLAEVAKTTFAKNGNIDFHLGDFIHHVFSDAYAQDPQATAQDAWLLARDYLKDRISKEKLDSMDALANTPNGEQDKYSSDDISNKDAHELYIHMQYQLTHNLKPHEMVDVLWELTPKHDNDEHDLYDIMSKFYQYDPRSYQPKFAELGLKPKQGDRSFEFQSLVTPEEFSNYLDQSWKQAQEENKAAKNKPEKKSK